MKPRDIDLSRMLCGTFGKAEREQAAMLLIGFMAEANEWAAVRMADLHEYTRSRADRRWVTNPYFRPDLSGLERLGVLTWTRVNSSTDDTIAFTERGLALLQASGHFVPEQAP